MKLSGLITMEVLLISANEMVFIIILFFIVTIFDWKRHGFLVPIVLIFREFIQTKDLNVMNILVTKKV